MRRLTGSVLVRQSLVTCSAPIEPLPELMLIYFFIIIVSVNWTLSNKPQWNLNRNSNLFLTENASENVCKFPAKLSRGDELRDICGNRCGKSAIAKIIATFTLWKILSVALENDIPFHFITTNWIQQLTNMIWIFSLGLETATLQWNI